MPTVFLILTLYLSLVHYQPANAVIRPGLIMSYYKILRKIESNVIIIEFLRYVSPLEFIWDALIRSWIWSTYLLTFLIIIRNYFYYYTVPSVNKPHVLAVEFLSYESASEII